MLAGLYLAEHVSWWALVALLIVGFVISEINDPLRKAAKHRDSCDDPDCDTKHLPRF